MKSRSFIPFILLLLILVPLFVGVIITQGATSNNRGIYDQEAFVRMNSKLVNLNSSIIYLPFINKSYGGCKINLVSLASDGTQGNGGSYNPAFSTEGRYVAFESTASNLVSGDTNNWTDIFFHDQKTGETTRVSIATDGTQANYHSNAPSVSEGGRFVAFRSTANNLVIDDTNGEMDIFIHDRQMEETSRVSLASGGAEANDLSWGYSISSDARYVAFDSNADNLVPGEANYGRDIFVHDRQTKLTTRVSVITGGAQSTEGGSLDPSISSDGRYVAFISYASDLVIDDTNDKADVFFHDRMITQTIRVSVASDGSQANDNSYLPSISADGRLVAFYSDASNLVSNDTNGVSDVFIHDRMITQTIRISVASDGSQANGASWMPSISADGRYVAFHSNATNLVTSDTNNLPDAFVHDLQTGETFRVSEAQDGTQANGSSGVVSISTEGLYVVFHSSANNLVSNDNNGFGDIFVKRWCR